MRRIAATILTVFLLATAVAPCFASAAERWTDLRDSRYAQAMVLLAQADILRGDGSGRLLPDATINRAEFCAMVVRAIGLEGTSGASERRFPDVIGPYSWAAGAVATAASEGIVAGDDHGLFRPGDPVTVGEAASMLVRTLGYDPEAAQSRRPWPGNYLGICERLGIWTLVAAPASEPLSRGMAAQALRESIALPMRDTQATMLSASNLRLIAGEVAGATDSTLIAPGTIYFADGTIGAADGAWDRVNLSGDTVIWGLDNPSSLVGRTALCLIGHDGRALFASPTMGALLGSVLYQGGTAQVALSDGATYSASVDAVAVSLNHSAATIRSLTDGDWLRVDIGLDGEVAGIDALRGLSGDLQTALDHDYWIDDQSMALPFNVSDDTAFTINGRPADKAGIGMALLLSPDVHASLIWDTTDGTVARVDVTASGDPTLTGQPITALGHCSTKQGDARFIRLPGTAPGSDREFLLTPTSTVLRDGVGSTFGGLQPGDLVSLRLDGEGKVSYMEVTADTTAPKLSLHERVGNGSEYSFTVDGAIQPAELHVEVDGQTYYPGNGLNRLEFQYDYSDTTVTIVPALPFARGAHDLSVYARDYGDRELAAEVQFTVAPSSITFASVEWQSEPAGPGQSMGWLYFDCGGDDILDADAAKDPRNWTFTDANPANGITHIAAVTHAGYYVTVAFDGPIDPGSRLQASLLDTAGNTVTIDCVYGGR